jgi:hypothetical protein
VNGDPLTAALTTEVRRLSQAEINRTIRDTLKEPSSSASRLLSSDAFTPYDNNYIEQLSSAALVDGLDALATDVAARVLADPASRAAVIPCVPAAVDDEACFRQVVQTVGKRMLRRPVDDAEVATYLPLLAFARLCSRGERVLCDRLRHRGRARAPRVPARSRISLSHRGRHADGRARRRSLESLRDRDTHELPAVGLRA